MFRKDLSSYKNLNPNLPAKNNARRNKTIKNVVVVVFSVLFLITGIACTYGGVMLNRINTLTPDNVISGILDSALEDSEPPLSSGVSQDPDDPDTLGSAGFLGGLYHDDEILNILLLGVDDYQSNDIGRSDSMMLVSLDKRHKKLKVISLMRDMYVAIPGTGNGRINEAYSRGFMHAGEAGGGQLAVATVEANFGVDIDRYILIGNSAFDQIVDNLGGVEITLSAAEARQVNLYSGDPRKNLSEGTFILSGKQAHYYSRIRVIGDDFQRTQRQRNVISSIVNKFKSSDIGTINNLLYQSLNLIKTNMTKNEILMLAGNSLTYMNYPMEELRIPGDNEYEAVYVNGAAVLAPDRKTCAKSLADFIFEDDLPKRSGNNY